jgi:hypothetical protein
VFRWYRKDGSSVVIKYYPDPLAALADDEAFAVLRRASQPDDFVQVVSEVRPKQGQLRFLRDVRGITLGTLRQSKVLQEKDFGLLVQHFQVAMGHIRNRLEQMFGTDRIVALEAQTRTFRIIAGEGSILVNPHEHNIIVELATGRLWIIDPN